MSTESPLPPLLAKLAKLGKVKRYAKRTMLIHEGDQGDALFIVLSGLVRAFSANRRGREITYGVYGAGEYVGEMSLDDGPRSASVVTLQTTECSMITREVLHRFIAENPDFALQLLARVIRRARAATLSTFQLALNDGYGALARDLERRAVTGNDGKRIIPGRLTYQELASAIGRARSMISRLMQDLEKGGYIEKTPEGWVLHRPLPPRW